MFCIIYLLFHLEKCLGFLCLCLWSWKGKMRNPKLLYICVILFGVLSFLLKILGFLYLCIISSWKILVSICALKGNGRHKKIWFSLAKQLFLKNHMLSHNSYAYVFSFTTLTITLAILAFYQLTLTTTITFMPIKKWVSVWICR